MRGVITILGLFEKSAYYLRQYRLRFLNLPKKRNIFRSDMGLILQDIVRYPILSIENKSSYPPVEVSDITIGYHDVRYLEAAANDVAAKWVLANE